MGFSVKLLQHAITKAIFKVAIGTLYSPLLYFFMKSRKIPLPKRNWCYTCSSFSWHSFGVRVRDIAIVYEIFPWNRCLPFSLGDSSSLCLSSTLFQNFFDNQNSFVIVLFEKWKQWIENGVNLGPIFRCHQILKWFRKYCIIYVNT